MKTRFAIAFIFIATYLCCVWFLPAQYNPPSLSHGSDCTQGVGCELASGTTATTQNPLDFSDQVATTDYTDTAVAAVQALPYLSFSPSQLSGAQFFGPIGSLVPPGSNGAWANQGGSTLTNNNNSLEFDFANIAATDNVRGYLFALPASTGYTATVGINSVSNGVGACLSDGTKFIFIWQSGQGQIQGKSWTTATGSPTTYLTTNPWVLQGQSSSGFFVRFRDAGSKRGVYICANDHLCQQIDSQNSATVLTETKVGICFQTNQTFHGSAALIHLSADTP